MSVADGSVALQGALAPVQTARQAASRLHVRQLAVSPAQLGVHHLATPQAVPSAPLTHTQHKALPPAPHVPPD